MDTSNSIPIISLFTGGGFLDMGFEEGGFKTVWANEFDEAFIELYKAGMSSWRCKKNITHKAFVNGQSILDISSEQIIEEAFNSRKPNIWGLIGGPPCQDFTLNGKQVGFEGERGQLTITFFDKVRELKPSFFVMENVPGILRKVAIKDGLKLILEGVKKDYHIIEPKILNAIEFGVPQSRERVFIIGINRSVLDLIPEFEWQDGQFKDALKRYNWPKIEGYMQEPEQPFGIPENLFVGSCLVPEESFSKICNANEYFKFRCLTDKIINIREGDTNRQSFKRLHRFRYSPTACYGNNEVHLHPYLNRRLSVREALKIQSVEDIYILPPDILLSKKFKMIGNGVPVKLGKGVATSLMNNIKKWNF